MKIMENPIIPEAHIFACIALQDASISPPPEMTPFTINEGTYLAFSNPFELDQAWKESIGSLRYKRLKKSNIVFISHEPDPADNNGGKQRLDGNVTLAFSALLLLGLSKYNEGFQFFGSRSEKKYRVDSITRHFEPNFHNPYDSKFSINQGTLDLLSETYGTFKEIYNTDQGYVRLKKGLVAFLKAATYEDAEDQLHQYVRAIEAVMHKSKREEFAGRAILFFRCDGKNNEDFLEKLQELYQLRSRTEHFNQPEVLQDIDKKSQLAKLVARNLYIKLIANKKLLEFFLSDSKAKEFWKKSDLEKNDIIGELINWEELKKSCGL